MQVLADNGAYVLAEDGSRLLFLRRRILPTWAVFVPGLLAVLGVGNGVVQLVLGNLAAGLVLLALGGLSAAALAAGLRSRRRTRSAPLDPAHAVVVLDLGARTLFDGAGRALAPLDQVRVGTAMQLTSSSRALRVAWPGGSIVVYRGDPFVAGGAVDRPIAALAARGVAVAG